MQDSVLKVENLNKKFSKSLKRALIYGLQDIACELIGKRFFLDKLRKDEFWSLKNVNFELKQGEILGIIGPNGAGKTTLLKLISGLMKPDHGRISIKGKIRALIALGAGFNPILSGRENIYINGSLLGFKKTEIDEIFDKIVEFSEVGEFIDMPVQNYSSGMYVRLGFAVAVHMKPDILIVDEVLSVGDANFKAKAQKKMMELLHSGISVIFVSHNMGQVESLCNRTIYLDRGNIKFIGKTKDAIDFYLQDSLNKEAARRGKTINVKCHDFETFTLKDVILKNNKDEFQDEFVVWDDVCIEFFCDFLKCRGGGGI